MKCFNDSSHESSACLEIWARRTLVKSRKMLERRKIKIHKLYATGTYEFFSEIADQHMWKSCRVISNEPHGGDFRTVKNCMQNYGKSLTCHSKNFHISTKIYKRIFISFFSFHEIWMLAAIHAAFTGGREGEKWKEKSRKKPWKIENVPEKWVENIFQFHFSLAESVELITLPKLHWLKQLSDN